MLASGNLYGYNALKGAGLLKSGGPLDDSTIAELEQASDRASTKAMANVAAFDPGFIAQLASVHADIESGRIKAPMDAATRIAGLNQYIMAKTGSDVPMFDTDKITSTANAVTDASVAAARRQEERQWQADNRAQERQWQLEDRQAAWDHEEQAKAADLAATAAQVGAMFGQGDAAFGIAAGLGDAKDYNLLATKAWTEGNMAPLAKAFVGTQRGGGYVAEPVARMAQSQVEASSGKYTEGFKGTYQKWKALSSVNSGAAAAYYGKYNLPMQKYDGLIKEGVTPVLAYDRAFADPSQYDMGRMPPGQRKGFQSALDSAVDRMDRSFLHPGRWSLAGSSLSVIKAAIGNEAVPYMAHTGMSPEAVINNVLPKVQASGRLEIMGRLAWINDPGTAKLPALLGVPEDMAASTVMAVADRRLKAAGFADGVNGNDYLVHRIPTAADKAALYILALSPDGDSKEVLITQHDLRAEINGNAEADLKRAQPRAVLPKVAIGSEATAARRAGYAHAMDSSEPAFDVADAAGVVGMNTLDIVGLSKRTGDAIIGGVSDAATGAVQGLRKQFRKTSEHK